MSLFKWNASYSVYIGDIDVEHREIFRAADNLHRAIFGGSAQADVQAAISGLILHAGRHFAHEERLMRSAKCPSYLWHKGLHDAAAARAAEFKRRFESGDTEAALGLLHFLSDWIKDHMRLADRMMGAHLRNYERAHAA